MICLSGAIIWRLVGCYQVIPPPHVLGSIHTSNNPHFNVSSYGLSHNTACVQKMDKEKKKAFFDELYKLDDSESEEDRSNAEEILRQSRQITQRNKGVQCSRPDNPLGRTFSAPLPPVSTPSRDRLDDSVKAPIPSHLSHTSHTAKRDGLADTSRQDKRTHDVTVRKDGFRANHKRKRGQSMSLMPESQQIFRDLSFCTSQGV